jgi:hypothetical protein
VILKDTAALILKIYVKKITTNLLVSKMFRDGGANSSFSPVDFSPIGKCTSLGRIFYSKFKIPLDFETSFPLPFTRPLKIITSVSAGNRFSGE